MAKITVTFQEEGAQLIAFEIPASVAAKLDQKVADSQGYYSGKADLFLKHNIATLLKPVSEQYAQVTETIRAKNAQIEQLQLEIAAEITGGFLIAPV